MLLRSGNVLDADHRIESVGQRSSASSEQASPRPGRSVPWPLGCPWMELDPIDTTAYHDAQ